jgi:succinyl-CoA synthetase beta subunit
MSRTESWAWERFDVLLTEADGKALFAEHGIPIPAGVVVMDAVPALPGDGPWMVKAQVPVGGRGKAGGIVRCDTRASVEAAVTSLLGSRLKGHAVDACLLEAVAVGQERYLAIMVDPASYGLRVIYSARGGVEVEQTGSSAARLCPPHPGAVAEVLADLIAGEPDAWRDTVAAIGKALAEMLLTRELALAEINPLFVSEAGCVAADAKVVVDLNAIDRQSRIAEMIAARPAIYVDACRKIAEGFDYVELDPQGEIGLVTTGAGLSMMLIDELTARGAKPLNFCDIRTGQMRGSPARLIRVLAWITARPSLKAVLVNIFAGITDLGEFASLLAAAIQASPALQVPVVARLVGRNAAEAQRILAEAQPGMLVTENLAEALARIDAIVGAAS